MASLRSPEDLCDRLGLKPSEAQREVMQRFERDENPLQVLDSGGERLGLAVAIGILWRLLCNSGSKVLVIASNERLGGDFFGFLQQITTKIDPALNAVCRWKRWNTLKIGHDSGYECKMLRNVPALLQGRDFSGTTFVVLGAGGSDTAFVEMQMALEQVAASEGVRLIRVW